MDYGMEMIVGLGKATVKTRPSRRTPQVLVGTE